MRPVRLDIEGFASFREPAFVDFTDVDYFALVGPTGAGKSTIIDAITFALYGTAHRWERANAISYALAPTTNRCTVSLIFDLSGQRYQAVREVRRVGQAIQQKAARLERFLDATACPAPGDDPVDTEVLASEVNSMTPTVEELLGMDFNDFCQCVVLPQGEFARFLKAAPRERQTILLKLLGAGHYDQIGKLAGARVKEAETEGEVFAEQLRGLADVTPEALEEATRRHGTLDELSVAMPGLVGPVLSARGEHESQRAAADAAAAAAATLRTTRAPDGLADRQADLTTAGAAHAESAAAAEAATTAAEAATREYEEGPQRPPLEAVADLYREADQVRTSRQTTTLEVADTEQAVRRADAAAANAEEIARQSRAAADQARETQREVDARLAGVKAKLTRLRTVTVPADLDEVATSLGVAATAVTEAEAAVVAARSAATQAGADCVDLPDLRTVGTLEDDVAALLDDLARWNSGFEERARLEAAASQASAALEAAAVTVQSTFAELERAREIGAAAALRPSLVVGHECPVCTQTVSDLPPAVEGPDLRELATASEEAKAQHNATAAAHRQAVQELGNFNARHDSSRDALVSATRRIHQAVSGVIGADAPPAPAPLEIDDLAPDAAQTFAAEVRSVLAAERDRCTTALARRDHTQQDLDRAEASLADARSSLEAARESTDAHRTTLNRAHATLEPDEPPFVDATDSGATVTGWRTLAAWRDETATALETEQLPTATQASRTAEEEAARAAEAELRATQAAQEATTAARTEAARASAARASLDHLTTRDAGLTTRLSELPARDDLPSLLAEADRLADLRAQARAEAEGAQARLREAAAALETAERAVTADREQLGSARDAVATWGPPTFSAQRIADDLAGCFADLLAWAAAQAGEQAAAAAAAEQAATAAAQEAAALLTSLVATITEHELPSTEVEADPRAAERVVAVAASRAAAEADKLSEALTRKDGLVTKAEEANKRAVVAKELRSLLRSDKFQQWLATAALDNLAAGASEGLSQLSDGQFTLTHERGEFFVIDHFDADSHRSVRTLSGGETFQASLALALALSEQLAALALGGTARLDSIFLDEGFGTLDPEALETVAATLENLAHGERMVGVVTHVAALAERTPVRYQVTHDNRTSRVERETA